MSDIRNDGSTEQHKAHVPEINFDRLKISQQVLAKYSINFLPKALRNCGEVIHRKEVMIPPHVIS